MQFSSFRCWPIVTNEEAEIYLDEPDSDEEMEDHLYDQSGEWLVGKTEISNPFANGSVIFFDDEKVRIEPGCSGAPIFEATGKVVGLISRGNLDRAEADMVYPANCLPGWVLKRVKF